MMDYRRMGNMELNLGNTTSSHHSRHVWGSPRWTVIRIQALALVSIILSFLLANFGSCRRWSNRWIVQKGFFAAHVLSLSLGTYSIGLMQSSPVKSEMYPIWTISLFTLFGCIDPVTDYNGLDYKGPLSKVVYGICLNFGYVLLMSISTISNAVGNTAIGMLSAITFIKGFHRSLALMQQRRIRNLVLNLETLEDLYCKGTIEHYTGREYIRDIFVVDMSIDDIDIRKKRKWDILTLVEITEDTYILENIKMCNQREVGSRSCYDVCLAHAMSHQLQGYFLGMRHAAPDSKHIKRIIMNFGGYKWFLVVIETELAFIYEVFFTGNPFLHYYQAKAASLWALASFIGICFVGVAAAIPGTMTSHGSGYTNVVDTTTADLVITFGILVSLALLQLLHLIQGWTSNWAKLAVACAYARQTRMESLGIVDHRGCWWTWWMRLKTFVATSTNRFDEYLWQDKIGQYSMTTDWRSVFSYNNRMVVGRLAYQTGTTCLRIFHLLAKCCPRYCTTWMCLITRMLYRGGASLAKMLGLNYIREVLWDLLGSDTSKRSTVRLEDNVKASIIEFLSQIETNRLEGNWLSFSNYESIQGFLPYCNDESESAGHIYTSCITVWHIATRYCELVEDKIWNRVGGAEENGNRRVASALSKYCSYLVVSAPELLPGHALDTKRTYNRFVEDLTRAVGYRSWLLTSNDPGRWTNVADLNDAPKEFSNGVHMGNLLLGVPKDQCRLRISDTALADDVTRRSDPWETLAQVWVRLLVYAAPYGNREAHRQHLAQGGEFITHLWALLFHLDIREWKHPEKEEDLVCEKTEKKNLHNITTMDGAKMITTDDMTVVAFVRSLSGPHSDELSTVSNLGDGVRFYQTSSPDVAKHFHIDPEAGHPALVLLNKEAEEIKFTLYDGSFCAYDIAHFVTSNKLAFEKTRAQGTASSSVDNPIKKQSSEDGGQAEDEIGNESSEDGGHAEDKIGNESSGNEIEEVS